MCEYIKIMYSDWIKRYQGDNLEASLDEFCSQVSILLFRTEAEIREFCVKQGWFK